jgi:hypothetical protein
LKRRVALLGVAVLSCLVLFLGYWLCFAFWMTAYYTEPRLLGVWQTRCYFLFGGVVLACCGDLYFVLKAISTRKE